MKRNYNYQELLGEANPLLRYEKLFDASVNEFSQKKYEDASLNDILKNADMSKGSLYHHFGDKFGLYLCVFDIIIKKKITFFLPHLQKRENSGDFFGTIKDVVKGTMEFMYYDKRLHHLSNRYMDESEDFKQQIYTYFPYNYNGVFGTLIDSAIQKGQIGSRYSKEFVTKVFELLFTNADQFLSQEFSEEEIIKVVNMLVDFMQFGFQQIREE